MQIRCAIFSTVSKYFEKNASTIKLKKLAILALAAALVAVFIDRPEGLSERGWHMLILFISTTAGLMLEIFPLCGIMFVSILVGGLFGIIDLKVNAFTGFSNHIIWLLFLVLSLSKAITKTTIGLRISYLFVKVFGKNMIGLAYSVSLTELVLASILPSNTARAASVGVPLVTSMSEYLRNNTKGGTINSIGRYLAIVYAHSNALCSALFLTGMISNSVIIDILSTQYGITIDWISWLSYTAVPILVLLLLVPLIAYFTGVPKVFKLNNLKELAKEKQKELGAFTAKEKITLWSFLGMLVMWIAATKIGIPIITTTLLGLCILFITGVITIKDILSDYKNISSVIVLGTFFSYVACLSEYGVISWFNDKMAVTCSTFPSSISFYAVTIIYFFTHYFLSGEGARIIAFFSSFMAIGLALKADPMKLAMTLAVFSSFSAVLAHYASPMIITVFSSGYSTVKRWMTAGATMTTVIFIIWFSYIAIR